ncbi:MAG TPA: MFS transporter, partial [Sphingomicrobium sp.]|nr:MFS transporter [Sphingomicrobium sp.]
AAGLIAAATGSGELEAEGGAAKEIVLDVYTTVGWVAVGVGVLVILISPFVRRLMHLDTLKDDDELAGYKELGEKQAPGLFPQAETKPGREQF